MPTATKPCCRTERLHGATGALMEELACPGCGHHNEIGANFCSLCGAVLAEPELEVHTESVPSLGVDDLEDPPILVVVRGSNAGSRFALTSSVVKIGRHPESEIFLDDVTVSRRHAEVRRTAGGYSVVDVGSLNGTYVNGSRVEATELREADQLQVGKFKFVVVGGVHDDE